jgi:hypothetical protein
VKRALIIISVEFSHLSIHTLISTLY